MTIFQQMADLRNWWREKDEVWGRVYNDPNGFWFDGELGSFKIVKLIDAVNYFILTTEGVTVFKLSKDDERDKS